MVKMMFACIHACVCVCVCVCVHACMQACIHVSVSIGALICDHQISIKYHEHILLLYKMLYPKQFGPIRNEHCSSDFANSIMYHNGCTSACTNCLPSRNSVNICSSFMMVLPL